MLSRVVVVQVKQNSFFLAGLVLGLWLALVAVPLEDEVPCAPVPSPPGHTQDEYEPRREERPLGAGGAPAGRSVQRPRYYTTELGMRAPLLAAVLSDQDALEGRAGALNATASLLLPALRFFISASSLQSAPPRANVVGFTDSREMLRPFHALKYLADNFLDEYDFFFLVSDVSYVNARRLTRLVAGLSASQHVHLGRPADDDSQYCTLEGGVLLSNSVLRAVHGELDWCVRNSYSGRHHENVGRCVLHAAHAPCSTRAQGHVYTSLPPDALTPALADAVTVTPLQHPQHFHQLHVYVARVHSERARAELSRARRSAARAARHHPPHYRNHTWPAGMRDDPGLAPTTPESRFDHLRWTLFNDTHAFLPDDHRALAAHSDAHRDAIQLVLRECSAWCRARWRGVRRVSLVEGARRWEPASALRYRLLLALTTDSGGRVLRQVEAARVLGAARLVPVPYVTESARVHVVMRVTEHAARDALDALQRYEDTCLRRSDRTHLLVVLEGAGESLGSLRESARALGARHGGGVEVRDAGSEAEVRAALHALPRDALLLLVPPAAEYNEDFLNRVRMNTIAGAQWYLPVAFARYAQYTHPRFLDAEGRRPQVNTGRFNVHHHDALAVYRRDLEHALESWPGSDWARALSASPSLRCVRAPEPGLVRAPRPPPCPREPPSSCHAELRDQQFTTLDLGARHTLAKLLLETQAADAA